VTELTLGDFLRTRRASLNPGDAGPPRRVKGLRREEVAQRVGVSVDYYVKLEQGKRRMTPSVGVLHALAAVLELDDPAREHMYDLARLERPRAYTGAQLVRPGTYRLMESFGDLPAVLLGRRTDVLAVNALARMLVADFPSFPARERNAVRWLLLDPGAREIHENWHAAVTDLIGMLRMDFGRYPDDPRTIALIEELTGKSEVFREIWTSGLVSRGLVTEGKVIRHPTFGAVRLRVEAVRITEDPDQTLHVMIPDVPLTLPSAMRAARPPRS